MSKLPVLLRAIVTMACALPMWVKLLLLALTLFAIFNALYHSIERTKQQENAAKAISQQQRWCQEFASRTDCSVVMHDNIQCPYKNVPNTFKVLDVSTCRDFAAEYAVLQTLIAKARATSPAGHSAAPFEVNIFKRTKPEN